jgi:hypothetical protein
MLRVASETTDSFMHANARAIVPASDLLRRCRRVALVTKRLALIRAHADAPGVFQHGGQW